MLWAALLLHTPSHASPPTEAQSALATWGLQFTPRVACVDEAVVMELAGSVRLFGGRRRLLERVRREANELGVATIGWAPTSLGALALARAGVSRDVTSSLTGQLDALPLACLSATTQHTPILERLGVRTLGQLRALPRGGLSRRFDPALLRALDQAYGLRSHDHAWVQVPDRFCERLELMSRVESAPALLSGARRLLLQLCGWLTARHMGVVTFRLRWQHDIMRSRTAGQGGELTLRTAKASRHVEHLSGLLAEHLARIELTAAVGEIELEAIETQPFDAINVSLLPDVHHRGTSLSQALERIAARLGDDRVRRPIPLEDHRLEWMVHWQAATQPVRRPSSTPRHDPQPTFILAQPLPLAVCNDHPQYQGTLHLLCGPQRVEGGWWHRRGDAQTPAQAQTVVRDYWVAYSEAAGVLWIFQTRLAREGGAWFLHGFFA